jgi:hypothetical protein
MFKQLTAFFFTLLLAVQPAIAITSELEEGDHIDEASFEHLLAGEEAPEDGYFVNPAGMAKLISDKNLLINEKDIQCKLQIDKLQIDIDKLTKEFTGKLEIQEKMFNSLLELKESKIKYLEDNRSSVTWQTAGLISVGFLASYAMFYLASNTVK